MNDRTLRLTAGQTVPDLFRYAIGLEQMLRDLSGSNTGNYPPHNIEMIDEDNYVLTLAVAGFSREEIELMVLKGNLRIAGRKHDQGEPPHYVYQGIAYRDFVREFRLGDHVRVKSASLKDGILGVALERSTPPEERPIPIEVR